MPCGNAFSPKTGQEEHDLKQGRDLDNMFSALELEEPSIEFLMNQAANAVVPPTPAPQTSTVYNIKDEKTEQYMATYCFYNDLHHLRRKIAQLWTDYRLRKSDLVSVSLATNSAFELAFYLETSLRDSFPELSSGLKICAAPLKILQ